MTEETHVENGMENLPDQSVNTREHQTWWSQQSETLKAAYVAGFVTILVAVIGLIPKALTYKSVSTEVTSETEVTGETEISDDRLPSEYTPQKIMTILHGRSDDSDRAYAAKRYEGLFIGGQGWDAVITKKSTPTDSGHVVDALSEGVYLTIFSEKDLRYLAVGDEIRVSGKVQSIRSSIEFSDSNRIYVIKATISLIGHSR